MSWVTAPGDVTFALRLTELWQTTYTLAADSSNFVIDIDIISNNDNHLTCWATSTKSGEAPLISTGFQDFDPTVANTFDLTGQMSIADANNYMVVTIVYLEQM